MQPEVLASFLCNASHCIYRVRQLRPCQESSHADLLSERADLFAPFKVAHLAIRDFGSVKSHTPCAAASFSSTTTSQKPRALVQKPKADLASLASLTALPTHLARIKKTGTEHIICGALSSDGGRLAFSEQAGLHVYELSSEAIAGTDTGADAQAEEIDVTASSPSKSQQAAGGQAERKLVHLAVPERLPTFHELHFRPGASQLVGLTAQGSLLIVDMDTAEVCNHVACFL